MGIKTKMDIRSSLNKKLDDAKMRNAMRKAMTETMIGVNKAIQRKTPVKTGRLRDSMNYQTAIQGDTCIGEIFNSTKYWTYVNFGTSKMEARNFVEGGYQSYKPETKLAKNFKKMYKGGS